MNLFQETRSRLKWFFPLAALIHRTTARQLLTAVTAFIVGQLSLVMAMLLPLKAILLAATEGVPWYLSWLVSEENKDPFIVALVLGSLLLYGINLLSERIIAGQLHSGATHILKQSKKFSLFRDDRALVRRHYLRFCRIISSVILFILVTIIGALLNPSLFIGMLGLISAEYLLFAHILRQDDGLRQKLEKSFEEERSRVLTTLTNANFLTGFVILFTQFLASEERNAILAIVSFLLLRQMTNRLRLAISDFISLSDDQHRINPLFHTNVHYVPPTDIRQEAFLHSMHPQQRLLWIPEALASVTGKNTFELIESQWNDTPSPGIAALDIRTSKTDEKTRRPFDYFLYCFSNNQTLQAQHVAHLFESTTPPQIAPHYLGRTSIADFTVLVFQGLPASMPSKANFTKIRSKLISSCEQAPLAQDLQDNYLRTHRTLTQRFDSTFITRLHPAMATPRGEATMHDFENSLPQMLEYLNTLPAVFKNPDISRNFCRINDEGKAFIWSWHRWRIDLLNAETLENQGENPPYNPSMANIDSDLLCGESGKRILVSHLEALEATLRRGQTARALRHVAEINLLWLRIQNLPPSQS